MYRSMIAACVLVALTGSVRTASADDIPCPVQKATWVVTTPLPDPWSSQVEVGTLARRTSAFINGRDWIICRYANGDEPNGQSVFDYGNVPEETLSADYHNPVLAPAKTSIAPFRKSRLG